jgi:two-component system, OmpR family, alkaline phosphatase synthesis response regulator PhoP
MQKILVIDDDVELVELLRFNFKQAGFSIGTAFNGMDGLKKARSIHPDLIVIDLMMPELDGFVVCEMIRRNERTSPIPIIMLTAFSSEFGRITGLESGATEYMTKPFSPKTLVARVQELLSRRAPESSAV